MISMVDDAVGDIVNCLKQTGLMEDTVICYNSDHGDYLGDFNMLLKGALPFRSITRVPFIWSDPDSRQARNTETLASTVDLAPTILQRAGLEPFAGNQGCSFLGALDGTLGERDDLLIEYNDGGARLGFSKPSRVRAVVSDRWRYTAYLDQSWGELYDLQKDPHETNNLWDSEHHHSIRAELSERLNQHLIFQMDESPQSDRIA